MNTARTSPIDIGTLGRFRWLRWGIPLVVLGCCGAAAVWYWGTHGSPAGASSRHSATDLDANPDAKVPVEVTRPQVGGNHRISVQSGTLEPFESAELYAKVSGFLIEQNVNIGSRVKEGQPLAKLYVPEYETQVQRDEAAVQRAKAHVQQILAAITAAEAEARAASSGIELAEAEVQSKTAYRRFRKKQLDRMRQLSEQKAVDERLVDEKEEQFEAAFGAENASKVAVATARLKAEASQAKILQAQADREDAQAQVRVAEAELARARVLLGYTEITSPYDGVITRRSFYRGDFVRSADAGGERVPLFAVERTDKMRVIVQVPDRDVPYVSVGDPATVEIDALPGHSISAAISRCAESEDATTRTMRTEIDIPNPDGKLRRGMYGRATLQLVTGRPDALTVPSTAMQEKAEGNRATIRVVREGLVRNLFVVTGADNGVRIEILSGLTQQDQVILRASGPIQDGTPVAINATPSSGH